MVATPAANPRVVMIALDAFDGNVFEHLMETGALPNLARFVKDAGRARVRSEGATLHGSLWPTFATGTGPGVHGMYFWTQWIEEEMAYARNSHQAFAIEPFWKRIGELGLPLTILDAPYVPLVRQPDSVEVSAWGMHDELEEQAWPEGYRSRFEKRFGKHPLSFDTVEPQSVAEKVKMVREMHRGVALRAKATRDLLNERPGPGFHFFVFSETHKAGHYLAAPQQLAETMTNVSGMGHILEPLDVAWPEIVEAAGPDAHIFLFSLHGTVHQVDFSASLGNQVLAMSLGKEPEIAVARPDLLRRIRNLLPSSLHQAIWRRLPARFRASREGARNSVGADLEHDPVFRIAHDGHVAVRANLEGRERDGRFDAAATEAALESFETLAGQFQTADGLPAFAGMIRPPADFPGPRAHRLPDGLLLSNPRIVAADHIVGPGGIELTNTEPEARNGIHSGQGFLFARFAEGSCRSIERAEIDNRDFAPSISGLFGLPELETFEGRTFLS